MSRLPRRFRTLRWRLTLSFFVAAFVALMSLEGVFVLVPSLFAPPIAARPPELLQGLAALAPRAAVYLASTPPDAVGLNTWLHINAPPVASIPSGVVIDTMRDITIIGGQNATISVVDTAGQVVASATPPNGAGGNLAGIQQTPEAKAALAAVLAGQTGAAETLRATPDGRTVVAVQIRNTSGALLGALFLGVDLPALQDTAIRASLFVLLFSALPFALIASILGVIFGLMTARQLTRRLQRLAAAAESWSRGEFGVSARDSSGDELGQLARDLNRMAEQVQALLATRQELAIVEERNRLARDLHDSVKQQVFAASMQVAAARALLRRHPAAAEARLSDVERMVSEAQRELTALILELRPAALGSQGLAPALRDYCGDWSRRTGIAVEVRVRGERPAPLAVEQALFRIAQEALANVTKHSGATTSEVRLIWEDGALTLAVTDNGSGFDAISADGKGVGLSSMRERIEAIGGALSIGGVAGGSGTRVEAVVPLAASPAVAAPPVLAAPSAAPEKG